MEKIRMSILKDIKELAFIQQAQQEVQHNTLLSDRQRSIVNVLIKPSKRRTQEELQLLIPIISKIQFFKEREISQNHYFLIVECLQYEFLGQGQTVFDQGDYGDKFYIIIDGEVSVRIINKERETKKREYISQHKAFQKFSKIRTELKENMEQYEQVKQQIPAELEAKFFAVKDECDKRKTLMDQLENEMERLPEFNELVRLGPGKSFGEKALINKSLRAANVTCTQDCHFAIMVKSDYERVLKKIELRVQKKIIEFLQQIPYLSKWSKKQILNFNYYTNVREYLRGQIVFKEGDDVDHIAIVKQGSFEVTKRIPKEINNDKQFDQLVTLLKNKKRSILEGEDGGALKSSYQSNNYVIESGDNGGQKLTDRQRSNPRNVSPYMAQAINQKKYKPAEDITMSYLQVSLLGTGQVFGDIDLAFERNYVYTLRAQSSDCQLYLVKSSDFSKLIKNVKDTWQILEQQCIEKNRQLIDLLSKQYFLKWSNKKKMTLLQYKTNMEQQQQQQQNQGSGQKSKQEVIDIREQVKKDQFEKDKVRYNQMKQQQQQLSYQPSIMKTTRTYENDHYKNNTEQQKTPSRQMNIDLSTVQKTLSTIQAEKKTSNTDVKQQQNAVGINRDSQSVLQSYENISSSLSKFKIRSSRNENQSHIYGITNNSQTRIPSSQQSLEFQRNYLHTNTNNRNLSTQQSKRSLNFYDERQIMDQLFQHSLLQRSKTRIKLHQLSTDKYDQLFTLNIPSDQQQINNQSVISENNNQRSVLRLPNKSQFQSFSHQQQESLSYSPQVRTANNIMQQIPVKKPSYMRVAYTMQKMPKSQQMKYRRDKSNQNLIQIKNMMSQQSYYQ